MVAPIVDGKNFGPPCKTHGKLKGGGGAVGGWECSRIKTGRERKSGWLIGMLGRRRARPRWENDLVWQSEMLGRRQGAPRWVDEPLCWIWWVLVNMGGLHDALPISVW